MSFNQSFFNLAPQTSSDHNPETEVTFITIVLVIVIAWILVALWTRVIENFAFGTLKLNGNSSWHSLIVAFAATIFFLVFVWMMDRYKIVPGSLATEVDQIDIFGSRSGENILGNSFQSETNINGVFMPSNI